MKRYITAFFMAWGMFCAVPCPRRDWDDGLRPLMTVFLPVIGLIIGGIWALVAWALTFVQWGLFGAVVLTACPWLLSGLIHLDGFMDCCDAIFSRRDLEQRQKILKDSTVGAFAVISFALLALGSVAAFSQIYLERHFLCLLFLPVASRCVCALAVQNLPPMGSSQYAGEFSVGKKKSYTVALIVELVLAVTEAFALCGFPGASALLTAAVTGLMIQYASRQLGGMSGDISGFALTAGEFCGVLSLLLN